MKNSANSNIYGYAQDATWERFAAHLDGSREAAVCVASSSVLGASARDALEKSFDKLGYGASSCAYVTLGEIAAGGVSAEGAAAAGKAAEGAAAAILDARELFALVEGLDPLVIVATDSAATELFAAAYRMQAAYDAVADLMGRRAVFFARFESLLAAPEDKQRAWALLKKLKA